MPKIYVRKSIQINAPASEVFLKLNDFHQWPAWSPWLIQEPEAAVNVAKDGKSYSWEGKRVGSGNMKVLSEIANQSLRCDLNFIKPWKSHAITGFQLKEKDGGTEVTWTMDSSLPFFMFWMKKRMVAFIGADYDRGLQMLKDLVEEGKVHSALDFKGESNFDGCTYIGVKTSCTTEEVGSKMSADFEKIMANVEHSNIAGTPLSIYHKWDLVNGTGSYTAAVPVKEVPNPLPDGMLSGSIPPTRIYTLRHTGKYIHLGNAWTTLYGMHRAKTLKMKKGIHPFETYINDPAEVAPEALITDINFAVP